MSDFDYKSYLASREWAKRKEAIRERSHNHCERCAIANYEETHHVTYEHIGNEPLEDLLAVCRACHQFLSAKSDEDPSEAVHFYVVAGNEEALIKLSRTLKNIPNARPVGFTTPQGLIWLHTTLRDIKPAWIANHL